MGQERPAKRTPVTPEQVFLALGLAWQTLTGSTPDRKIIHILHAQSALETGHWKSVMNYNLGGAKRHGDSDWCFFTTTERLTHPAADKLLAAAKPGEVTVLKVDDQFKTLLLQGTNPRGQRFRRFPQRRNPTLQIALLTTQFRNSMDQTTR